LAAAVAAVCIAGAGIPRAAADELLLGRFPAVTEGGRTLMPLTLRDVLELAFERNFALQASRASEGAAEQTLKAARNRLQLTLSGSVGNAQTVAIGATINAPPAARTPPFLNLLNQGTTTFNSNLTQQDWFGNTYALTTTDTQVQARNLALARSGDTPQRGPASQLAEISTATGAVTLPLAQGQGRDFNRIPVGQAEAGLRLTRAGGRQQAQSLIAGIAQAYWGLVGQLLTVDVIEQAVALDGQLLQDNQVRVRAGTRVPSDVQATETQLAIDRRNLVQARLQALTLEDQLRAALGLDRVDFGIKPVDAPSLRAAPIDTNEQLQRVYANSPALASLEAGLQNTGYDLLAARNAVKPLVNLGLSYAALGVGRQAFEGTGQFDRVVTQGNSAALSVSAPLLDRAGPATVERRLDERRALELQIRDQRLSLAIQLQNALRNIRVAQEQIEAAHAAVVLAQTQLDNQVRRLMLGASTAFVVAQLQQQLSLAQQQEIAARIQFELNDTARLLLTGEIYGRYGLDAAPVAPES
jgi:outer membrane protein TolC